MHQRTLQYYGLSLVGNNLRMNSLGDYENVEYYEMYKYYSLDNGSTYSWYRTRAYRYTGQNCWEIEESAMYKGAPVQFKYNDIYYPNLKAAVTYQKNGTNLDEKIYKLDVTDLKTVYFTFDCVAGGNYTGYNALNYLWNRNSRTIPLQSNQVVTTSVDVSEMSGIISFKIRASATVASDGTVITTLTKVECEHPDKY